MPRDQSIDRLLNAAELLNGVLVAAWAFAGAVVLLSLLGDAEARKKGVVKVFGVDVPIKHAWVVFCVFTIGHAYWGLAFWQDCQKVLAKDATVRAQAWEALTGSKLWFFHGLVARVQAVERAGFLFYIMNILDPTTLLEHGVAVLVFFAILRVRNVSWTIRFATGIAAVIIVVVNWWIGSAWAIMASQLSQSGSGG